MFELFRLRQQNIVSKKRNAEYVKARKIICYIYHLKGLYYKDIAPKVNLTESGVKYAVLSLKSEMKLNKALSDEVQSYVNRAI